LSELDKTRKESIQSTKEVDKMMVKLEADEKSCREQRKKMQLFADILPKSNPDKERLNIFLKSKLEEKEPNTTTAPLTKSEEMDDSLAIKTEAVKKAGRMIERFMSKDSSSNKALPLNASKLQLNNTQVNKGR
ncbi:MAG: hypothetical protein LN569_05420, partial [Rickettsia endosymbiont of Labidopullus appendiculatus]|nr:hypothetical protein [Rickettsia endosymbiont of Labidopullus appendiculatus]